MPEPLTLQAIENAAGKSVLIIGELWLDTTISGTADSLSAEAPVPLIRAEKTTQAPGGAGNLAVALAALGASPHLISLVGEDENADILVRCLERRAINTTDIITEPDSKTAVRTRVMARDQHDSERMLAHIETMPANWTNPTTDEVLIRAINDVIASVEAVVILESPGLVAHPEIIKAAQQAAHGQNIPCFGDVATYARHLKNYDVILPNERELTQHLNFDEEKWEDAARHLITQGHNAMVAVTRGQAGISLITNAGREDIRTAPREVFDVTGAGDTTTAAFVQASIGGALPAEAAALANLAAWVAVGRPGLAVVTIDDMHLALAEQSNARRGGKLRTKGQMQEIIQAARARGEKIAFTNGCFDLLHPGHVTYLRQARQMADMLVVGINSDASIRTIKGPTRPILSEDERSTILSGLESVTWIVVFDEPSAEELLIEIKPDIWVKGGDYSIDTLNQKERNIVENYGGRIVLIPPVKGVSTSGIIERIRGDAVPL